MQTAKSVVISCAGIGSRLGMGTTKALIDVMGRSLISWQLELFKDVEDVRIVVGFQAHQVVEEVIKYRPDAIFVYNHNYFTTKTGASYFLGAKDAREYVIGIDGDLLIHPDDIRRLLEYQGEWIAYADKMSDDGVYVNVNSVGDVLSFSRVNGDFEWTGPCCLCKKNLKYTSENVYNQLESYLPMHGIKVRACDIDTYDDYQRAVKFIESWGIK